MFLDTNVLVAAFASRGICADLLRHVFVEHEFVTGEVVLTELKRTLSKRIQIPARIVSDIERLLRDHEVIAKPRRHLQLGLRDPDDEWIIASAVAGRADALVTGDKDILEAMVPIRVYTPRQFWEQIRGEPG
ncbi:MAG TPA: putative toxin-antitoxin system toxin component, PIN family [Polyangia bacterium]|nr:putative toxin-antitoxin system toxin component, PIN family [Polyangia bacterium]